MWFAKHSRVKCLDTHRFEIRLKIEPSRVKGFQLAKIEITGATEPQHSSVYFLCHFHFGELIVHLSAT
jgi:hypothetical protein